MPALVINGGDMSNFIRKFFFKACLFLVAIILTAPYTLFAMDSEKSNTSATPRPLQIEVTPLEQKWIDELLFELPPVFQDSLFLQKIQITRKFNNRPYNNSEKIIHVERASHLFLFQISKKDYENLLNENIAGAEKIFKRAIAEVIGYQLNEIFGYSKKNSWKSINKWKEPLESIFVLKDTSYNLSSRGFAEKEGMKNPRADLVLFFAHYFVPDEKYQKINPDNSIRCRLMAQSLFLESFVHQHNSAYLFPIQKLTPACPAFEKWADIDAIDHLEVILASPSAAFVGSMFGHIFLRIAPKSNNRIEPVATTRTFGFSANSHGPLEADPFFSIKSVLGLYRVILQENPFSDFYRQYVLMENRDIFRYKLNFNQMMIRNAMGRIWTIKETGEYPYYFFNDNCGAYLFELINGVMPDDNQIRYPHNLASMPGATLEGYFHTKLDDNTPLITKMEENYYSLNSEILKADTGRIRSINKILKSTNNEDKTKVVQFLNDANSSNQMTRENSYKELVYNPDPYQNINKSDLYDYYLYSSVIENNFETRKNFKTEKEINRSRFKNIQRRSAEVKKIILNKLNKIENESVNVKTQTISTKTGIFTKKFYVLKNRFKTMFSMTESLSFETRDKGYNELLRLNEFIKSGFSNDNFTDLEDRLKEYLALQSYVKYDLISMVKKKEFSDFLFSDQSKMMGEQPYLQDKSVSLFYTYLNHEITRSMEYLLEGRQKIKEESPGILDKLTTAAYRAEMVKNESMPEYSHTGVDMLSLRAFYLQTQRAVFGGLLFSTALMDEEMGESRETGFPYYSGMKVLKSDLMIHLGPINPGIIDYQLTLIDYKIIEPKSRLEKLLFFDTGFQYGIFTGYRRNPDLSNDLFFKAEAGPLINLFHSARYKWFFNFGGLATYTKNYAISKNQENIAFVELPVFLELKTPLPFSSGGVDHIKTEAALVPTFGNNARDIPVYWAIKNQIAWNPVESVMISPKSPAKGFRIMAQLEIKGRQTPFPLLFTENLLESILFSLGCQFN